METIVDHSPITLEAVPPPGYLVDAKVLVISADGGDSELDAVQQALRYLGTPYDVIIASQAATLTAAQLATGTHGRYNAVILTRGNLVLSNGSSAFSAAEFQTLATYEATFQVRRVSLYTSPDAGYGYSGSTPSTRRRRRSRPSARRPAGRCSPTSTATTASPSAAPSPTRRRRPTARRCRCSPRQRAYPGRHPRLRRRARGAVAQLRAVAQPGPHAAAVSRRPSAGPRGASSWASGTRTSAPRSTTSFSPTRSTRAARSG